MTHSHIARGGLLRKPVSKLVQIESFIGNDLEDHFYTGFSNDIEQGGIFVTTYNLLPLHTPVEVTIHFPQGDTTVVQGAVEWIREPNPVLPDMYPGMGVGLRNLTATSKAIITSYTNQHPTIFLDSSELPGPKIPTGKQSDNIELKQFPLYLGPDCDLTDEHLFLIGIAQDVERYLNSDGPKLMHHHPTPPDSCKQLLSEHTWRVKVIRPWRNEHFQGGFSDEDGKHKLFIATPAPCPIGTRLSLQIICPSGRQLKTSGEVKWIRKPNPLLSSESAPPGMGISLLGLQDSSWNAIESHMGVLPICEPV